MGCSKGIGSRHLSWAAIVTCNRKFTFEINTVGCGGERGNNTTDFKHNGPILWKEVLSSDQEKKICNT